MLSDETPNKLAEIIRDTFNLFRPPKNWKSPTEYQEIGKKIPPKKLKKDARIYNVITMLLSNEKFNEVTLNITVAILDFLYRGRDYQRFWVLGNCSGTLFCILECVAFQREHGTSWS